ncbi:MAG: hypothetical protein KGH94_02060 [Candidatus Micrarchaeota archaeon]|nr:hypothetical protein [Candidatus Micrarchaeota archaeon]
MKEYKELLVLISDIESQQAKRDVSYVSMDINSGEQLSANPQSYPDLVSKIPTPLFGSQGPKAKPQQAGQTVSTPQKIEPQRLVARQPEGQVPPPSSFWPAPKFPSTRFQPKVQVKPKREPEPVQKQQPQPIKPHPFQFPGTKPAPEPQPTEQPKVPQRPSVQATPLQPQQSTQTRQIHQPEARPMVKVEEPAKPEAQQKPLEDSAAEELKKVVSSSKMTTPAPQPQAYEPTSKLVLPTLSLADQVEELDKIISNIKRSRFNSMQMEIVKQEVVGLAKLLASQPQQGAPIGGLDKDLADLRRIRLSEALSLIGGA